MSGHIPVNTPLAQSRSKTVLYIAVGIVIGGLITASAILVNNNSSPSVMPSQPPGPAPDGMVWIPGGTFVMGDDSSPDKDAPTHKVEVTGYWMDQYEVTNAAFAKFIAATGYVTVAERRPKAEDFPTVNPADLVPFSATFVAKECGDPNLCHAPVWWEKLPGAAWNHPEGPSSTIVGREQHPAIHLAWEDATAYAAWAGKRLPTEAEWEFAARGGLDQKPYVWGTDAQNSRGQYYANTFQGRFPAAPDAKDGFLGSAPVGSFPPNGYGLYDMSGNAWEWCYDWYARDYYLGSPKLNPQGPATGDPDAGGQPQKVRRGGSFLCADEYCKRYLPGTRDKNPPDSSACHTGFRCVKDAK